MNRMATMILSLVLGSELVLSSQLAVEKQKLGVWQKTSSELTLKLLWWKNVLSFLNENLKQHRRTSAMFSILDPSIGSGGWVCLTVFFIYLLVVFFFNPWYLVTYIFFIIINVCYHSIGDHMQGQERTAGLDDRCLVNNYPFKLNQNWY